MNRCYNCFIYGMRKTIALLLLILLPSLLFAGFFGVQAGFDFSYLDLKVKKNGSTKFKQEEVWLSVPVSVSMEFTDRYSGVGAGLEASFEKMLFKSVDGEDYDLRGDSPRFSKATLYVLYVERYGKGYVEYGAGLSYSRLTLNPTASSSDASRIGLVTKIEYCNMINNPIVIKYGIRIGTPVLTFADEHYRYRRIIDDGFSLQAYVSIGIGDS